MLKATWHAARGGAVQSGGQVVGPTRKLAARDLPAHTKLKFRDDIQDETSPLKRKAKEGDDVTVKHAKFEEEEVEANELEKNALESHFEEGEVETDSEESEEDTSDSDDEDGDEDDDMMEALRELERIKKEKAEAQKRKQIEQSLIDAEKEAESGGNNANFAVKKRWDDDVPFRNQNVKEKGYEKRFVNDTIRSDFHRKFMDRFFK